LQYFSLYFFEARDKKIINIIKITVSFLTKLSISPRGNNKNTGVYKASLDKKLDAIKIDVDGDQLVLNNKVFAIN